MADEWLAEQESHNQAFRKGWARGGGGGGGRVSQQILYVRYIHYTSTVSSSGCWVQYSKDEGEKNCEVTFHTLALLISDKTLEHDL